MTKASNAGHFLLWDSLFDFKWDTDLVIKNHLRNRISSVLRPRTAVPFSPDDGDQTVLSSFAEWLAKGKR